ncbi:MAG: DnaJ domain-containing protein [Heliobacteriaceae bacterium]|jgi:DnaJ-class molecular chaperone|nr:DnaJ domain-containing protein [Heliobacteriaceae bacterium]
MIVKKNYYDILGVTPDTDDAGIKTAYRRLARKYHPDVNGNADSRIFMDVSEAYDVLSNSVKRKQYDILNGFFKTKPTPPPQETKTKKQKPAPKKGEDIHTDITITLEESVNGASRTVNVMNTIQCPQCAGRKFINGTSCPECSSKGEIVKHKKITVKIPKGVKNGSKLRVANEGNNGLNGGVNGDLYLNIKISSCSKIRHDGANIHYKVPITPYEAALGGDILVPAFDGSVVVKIPPKTNSGQKFRLTGQGLSKNGKSGDMIVTVHIEIPASLSEDEIRLYEKLKKVSTNSLRENLLHE